MQGVLRFLFGFAAIACVGTTHALTSGLELVGWETNGWPRIAIGAPTNNVYSVQVSTTLTNWTTIATLHGREFTTNAPSLPYIDAGADGSNHRFYRFQVKPIEFNDDWRNQVYFPDDEFRNEAVGFGLPETRWIKFAILTNEPTRVYYQNSWKYQFHYNFSSGRGENSTAPRTTRCELV